VLTTLHIADLSVFNIMSVAPHRVIGASMLDVGKTFRVHVPFFPLTSRLVSTKKLVCVLRKD